MSERLDMAPAWSASDPVAELMNARRVSRWGEV